MKTVKCLLQCSKRAEIIAQINLISRYSPSSLRFLPPLLPFPSSLLSFTLFFTSLHSLPSSVSLLHSPLSLSPLLPYTLFSPSSTSLTSHSFPTLKANRYYMGHDINVTGVWSDNITGMGVVVAVVDIGKGRTTRNVATNVWYLIPSPLLQVWNIPMRTFHRIMCVCGPFMALCLVCNVKKTFIYVCVHVSCMSEAATCIFIPAHPKQENKVC